MEISAGRLNPYLVEGPDLLIDKRRKPLQADVPEMVFGSMPNDGGHLLLSEEDVVQFRSEDGIASQYIRPFLGAEEFINNTPRYCLWLAAATSADKAQSPELKKRIASVRHHRDQSTRPTTQKLAETPHLFGEIRQPATDYLLVPGVSSELRRFVPIGFLRKETIASNLVFAVPNATLYHFGMLSSTMHNAWMRAVAGRLESRYRYSNTIVYNNYPWPEGLSEQRRLAVEKAAQKVLDARELEFARCANAGQHASLALLYNPNTMPAELVKAHADLDRAIDAAYEYRGGREDASRVAFLFGLYQRLAAPMGVQSAAPARRKRKQ